MMSGQIVILILLLSSCLAGASPVELTDISPADVQRLRRELPTLFEDNPPLPVMDDAIRLLMLTGQYENVLVERDHKEKLRLTGRPLRIVEDVRFTGNRTFSSSDLKDLTEIKTGDRFERKKAVTAAEKIKQFYGENGFFNAIVELEFIKSPSNNMILSFQLKELSTTVIAGIEIDTPNTDLKLKLMNKLKRQIGNALTVERADNIMGIVSNYLIDNRYMIAEVAGPNPRYNANKTESYLQIEIREPYKWEFYFEGFETESMIRKYDLFTALDIRNRERKNLEPAMEGGERIKRYYLGLGYPHIQIDTEVRANDAAFLKRVTYRIHSGPRVKILKIDVQGRISRSSRYYVDFVKHNSTELISDGYYNRADLDTGFKNLVTELRNQGYLRARVQSSRIEYNKDRNKVVVYAVVDEGPLTQTQAIDFEGNRFFSAFELRKVMKLDTNVPLRLDTLEQSINNLKEFYQRQGFLEMRLLNEGEDLVQYNDKGTQARLLFKIFEGPRIRINSIQVEGNSFTKTRVILKEADFRVGEILTPQKIDDASSRLNKMGIFNRADIHTLEEGTSVSDRTLVISVNERDPGTFRFGAGVNDERGLTVRGFTGLSYNNLYGTGRAVSGRIEVKNNVTEVKYTEHEVTLGYLEPFVFDTRTQGRVNWTRSDRVFHFVPTDRITSLTLSNKFDFLLEKDFNKFVKFTWTALSLDFVQAYERDGRCLDPSGTSVLPGGQKCGPSEQQVAIIGPALDLDYRDNPFMPTRGMFNRLNIDYSDPNLGSSRGIQFFKIENTFSHYLRLKSPKFIWANSLRLGYLANVAGGNNSGIPASQAFFLGGLFSVRGFDSASNNNRIPPNWQLPFAKSTDILIRKDSNYGLLKSEFRFPISGEHGGVVFYDGGYVQVTGRKFDRPYRDSVGFGYRYNTPVGPVAVDLAFKINPRKDKLPVDHSEDDYRVHFSIGTF